MNNRHTHNTQIAYITHEMDESSFDCNGMCDRRGKQ